MPLTSSTNAPKVVVLTTLPCERVADLGLAGHRLDLRDALLDQLAVGGVDADRAVVLDVDLSLELLGEAADRLAALADDCADLLRVDLDRLDARCRRAELLARTVDRLGHLAEDEEPALTGLLQRLAQDVERDARDLDVHLKGVDALLRCRRP